MRPSRIAFSFRPRDSASEPSALIALQRPGMGMLRLPVEIRLHDAPRPAPPAAAPAKTPAAGDPPAGPAGFVPPGGGRNHPDRDNNPLDMRSGATTRRFGALGDDGGFAVFADARTGFAAASDRFDRIGGTLDHIISVWSPASDDNDTAGMQRGIPAAAGLSGDMHWNDLSETQKRAFLQAYARREGFHGAGPGQG